MVKRLTNDSIFHTALNMFINHCPCTSVRTWTTQKDFENDVTKFFQTHPPIDYKGTYCYGSLENRHGKCLDGIERFIYFEEIRCYQINEEKYTVKVNFDNEAVFLVQVKKQE